MAGIGIQHVGDRLFSMLTEGLVLTGLDVVDDHGEGLLSNGAGASNGGGNLVFDQPLYVGPTRLHVLLLTDRHALLMLTYKGE